MTKKFSKNFSSGFTLIELLVVIAVIGFFASVVLVALNSARTKGNDAGVKSNLTTVRAQADLYYTNNGYSYGTWNGGVKATCPTSVSAGNVFSDQTIISAIASAVSAGSGTSCIVNGTSYAIAVGMKTGSQAWCIDNSGISKLKTGVATPDLAITGSACN